MEEVKTKKPWLSRTVWLNVIALVGQFIPGVGAWSAAHPDIVLSVFAVANIVLRAITKDRLSLGD